MKLSALEKFHIPAMVNFGGQDNFKSLFSDKHIEELRSAGPSYAAMDGDVVLGAGGFIHMNEYRALGWGLFARTTPANFVKIHRTVVRSIAECPYRRIEAYVDPKFPQAMRWIKKLGFRMELPFVPYYFPDGSGASYWALHQDK